MNDSLKLLLHTNGVYVFVQSYIEGPERLVVIHDQELNNSQIARHRHEIPLEEGVTIEDALAQAAELVVAEMAKLKETPPPKPEERRIILN